MELLDLKGDTPTTRIQTTAYRLPLFGRALAGEIEKLLRIHNCRWPEESCRCAKLTDPLYGPAQKFGASILLAAFHFLAIFTPLEWNKRV